ncbi:hypothetical protein GB937_005845 [Aspergillus fischeri]|nr:hypothetical protein GB937_005845 [Aspergillus fischeri]
MDFRDPTRQDCRNHNVELTACILIWRKYPRLESSLGATVPDGLTDGEILTRHDGMRIFEMDNYYYSLKEEQIQSYKEKGYLLVEGFLNKAEAQLLQQ